MKNSKPFKLVNWSSGWIPFLLGLLTCLFWGGAVRVLFSDYQLSQWLNERIENHSQDWSLEVEKPKLVLSRGGGLPAFGFEVQLARVIPKDTCKFQNGLQVVQTYIPIALLDSLIQGQISFHRIEVTQATLLTFDHDCPDEEINLAEERQQLEEVKKEKKNKYNFSDIEKVLLEYNKNYEYVSQFPVRNLRFKEFWWQRKNNIMILRNLEVNHSEQLTMTAEADLRRWKSGLTEVRRLPVEIKITRENLNIKMQGAVREGKIIARFSYDPQQQNPIGLKFELKDFPVTQVLKMMEEPAKPSLSNLWISCVFQAEGLVSSASIEAHLSQCQLIEKEGKIELGDLTFDWPYLQKPQLKSKGMVFVKDWPISTLMKALGREGPSGVFKEYGKLSGEIQLLSPKDMEFNWKIEDSLALFSRANQKTYQKFNSIDGQLSLKQGRVSGIIENADLERGEFVGKMSFNLDEKLNDGFLQVGVDHLKFHPKVQKVMVGGVLGSMGIFGQAVVKDAKVKKWRGSFAVGKIFGEKWGIKRVKLKSFYDGLQFRANVNLAELTFASTHPFRPWLEKVLQQNTNGDWKFSPTEFDFEFLQDGVQWSGLKAKNNGKTILSSGSWKNKELFGELQLAGDGTKYALLGQEFDWFLRDEKNNLIPVFADSNVLPTVKAIEPIKNLGQQMLDTAKKIIPKGNENTKNVEKVSPDKALPAEGNP